MEVGIDYKAGEGGVIKDWQSPDLTKEGCAVLAASLRQAVTRKCFQAIGRDGGRY